MSIKTSSDHPVKHLGFPEASIEAVTKFAQVTGQVLFTDAMINSTDIAFDVGDQGMDPGAFWSYEKSCRPSARSGNHKLCRHINDVPDESKLARADSEGTDNLEANASQKDVCDKLFRF